MSEEFNSQEFVEQRTDRSSASGWQYANRPALITAAAVAQVASIYAMLLDIPATFLQHSCNHIRDIVAHPFLMLAAMAMAATHSPKFAIMLRSRRTNALGRNM